MWKNIVDVDVEILAIADLETRLEAVDRFPKFRRVAACALQMIQYGTRGLVRGREDRPIHPVRQLRSKIGEGLPGASRSD